MGREGYLGTSTDCFVGIMAPCTGAPSSLQQRVGDVSVSMVLGAAAW